MSHADIRRSFEGAGGEVYPTHGFHGARPVGMGLRDEVLSQGDELRLKFGDILGRKLGTGDEELPRAEAGPCAGGIEPGRVYSGLDVREDLSQLGLSRFIFHVHSSIQDLSSDPIDRYMMRRDFPEYFNARGGLFHIAGNMGVRLWKAEPKDWFYDRRKVTLRPQMTCGQFLWMVGYESDLSRMFQLQRMTGISRDQWRALAVTPQVLLRVVLSDIGFEMDSFATMLKNGFDVTIEE